MDFNMDSYSSQEDINANIQEVPNISAQDQIKNDLAVYFQEQNITDIYAGVIKLSELLTNSIIIENKLEYAPVIVKAWTALQIQKDTNERYYNSSLLGEFIYNSKVYSIGDYENNDALVYNVKSGIRPYIPVGLKSTRYMFAYMKLPVNFILEKDFNTSEIDDMSYMFYKAKFPANFRFNKLFVINTNKIESMFEESYITKNMFEDCNFKIDCKEEDIDRVFNQVHCKSPEYLQTISKQFNFIDYEHQDYMDTNNYPELREIVDLWYELQKQQKDEGSCILGAYLTFHYKQHKFFWFPPNAHQGELSWTIPLYDTIIPKLTELGCTCIHYEEGHMD